MDSQTAPIVSAAALQRLYEQGVRQLTVTNYVIVKRATGEAVVGCNTERLARVLLEAFGLTNPGEFELVVGYVDE